MGILQPNLKFTGSIQGLTAYKDRHSDNIIVQTKGGASAEKIQRAPGFVNTRRLNVEFKGMTRGSVEFRHAMNITWKFADYRISSTLTGLMKELQTLDTVSEWGKRSVLISADRQWLEGLQISKKNPLEHVLRTPVDVELSRVDKKAVFHLPALVAGGNFNPVLDLPYYQLFFVLGVVPDLHFDGIDDYTVADDFISVPAIKHETEWRVCANSTIAETFELDLSPYIDYVQDGTSLVATMAISFGKIRRRSGMERIKYASTGKVMMIA